MNIDTAFPSKYLKAADCGGKTVKLKIASWQQETMGTEQKVVLYFSGTKKGLVLNKTNALRISAGAKSKEFNDWIGMEIEVYPDMVDMQGRMVEAVRVRMPVRGGPAPAHQTSPVNTGHPLNAPPPASEADYGAILDDEVPF